MNEQLVNLVVRRVLDELNGPEAPAPAAPRRAGGPQAGRVWITADDLNDRAAGGAPVVLAPNELLTPAARDQAASAGIEVVRGPSGSRRDGRAPAAPDAARRVRPAVLTRTLGLVVIRPDAKAEAVLASAARGGVRLAGFADSACWMANTLEMCERIGAGDLAGGVIVARYAAAPLILAAKVRGIRPVQGVSSEAVVATLRQFDANVLVIEHTSASIYQMRTMIDRFAAGRRTGRDSTPLLEAVGRLEAEAQSCE